ncbi:formaldehyde dehydrogenase-like protein [Emericellopsis cladophorae]|uniref:alcohol dehydrogenase (NADP(+)) n=1 Tax=Emericellopsis cladophorae TaxID=2686198 RepID=A0A9Q0BDQ4_9HYPO|nr:formaldehyde dehydrogenase-like protein [Emericellopsis cladophorae]KAI6781612.1 formaldehyde dehydrogenase-like protein [Emericellopsis cladophorae]
MAENTNYEFKGWVGEDPSAAEGNMKWKTFEPKPWEETDVDIKITHSGICGSDLHTISSGWGPADYPCVVGHEIVGVAVRVGSQAEGGIKVGDVVGVGAQNDSCLGRDGPCDACDNNSEQYCSGNVGTYNSKHRNGGKSMGGYALYHRCPSHFVIKIPDGLAPEAAAPMLCGGVTVYSPLKHFGCGPGKKVGVVGVGGLGHFAVLFAKALGADEVVGISRKADKKDDALALGCDDYIATSEDDGWETKNKSRFDLIISTVSSPKVPFTGYIGMLKMDGTMVQVGAPEEALPLHAFSLIPGRRRLAGSMIGSPSDIRAMFQLAADKNVKPWIEQRPMSEANQAIIDFSAGKPRFRYVLVN